MRYFKFSFVWVSLIFDEWLQKSSLCSALKAGRFFSTGFSHQHVLWHNLNNTMRTGDYSYYFTCEFWHQFLWFHGMKNQYHFFINPYDNVMSSKYLFKTFWHWQEMVPNSYKFVSPIINIICCLLFQDKTDYISLFHLSFKCLEFC